MKVMHLLSSLKHDDSERGIYAISHALHKRGDVAVVVAGADSDDELVQRLEQDGNYYHRLRMPKKSWTALRQIWRLRRLMRQENPDIIHIHSRVPAWIAHFALQGISKRPKVVSSIYGFYPINNYSKALFFADHIISASRSIDHYLHTQLAQCPHLPKPPITCIRRGVDTRLYPYRHKPSVHWLQHVFAEFPELEKKQWLIFPTAIGNQQGQEWLIDILGNLKDDFPKLHLLIMDEPFLDDGYANHFIYEDFYQKIATLGLLDHVSFIGKHPHDSKDWLSSAQIVLALADKPESIGMTILQALHLGTPVIGWDKGAYHDILTALYPEGLIRDYNAKVLCARIAEQLDSKTRPNISYEYEIDTMVNDTLQVYDNLQRSPL